jgi:hypothetical protein
MCGVTISASRNTGIACFNPALDIFIAFVSSLLSYVDAGPYCDGLPLKMKKLTFCVGHLFGRKIKFVSKKRKNKIFLDGTPVNSYSIGKFMAVLHVLGTFSCACYCRSNVESKRDRNPPVVSHSLMQFSCSPLSYR